MAFHDSGPANGGSLRGAFGKSRATRISPASPRKAAGPRPRVRVWLSRRMGWLLLGSTERMLLCLSNKETDHGRQACTRCEDAHSPAPVEQGKVGRREATPTA